MCRGRATSPSAPLREQEGGSGINSILTHSMVMREEKKKKKRKGKGILHKAGVFLVVSSTCLLSIRPSAPCTKPTSGCSRSCQTHLKIHLPGGTHQAANTLRTTAQVCRQHKYASGKQHKAGRTAVVEAPGPQPSPFLEAAIRSLHSSGTEPLFILPLKEIITAVTQTQLCLQSLLTVAL